MDKLEITKRIDEITWTIADLLQRCKGNLDYPLDKDEEHYLQHLLLELQYAAPHVLNSHNYAFAQSIQNHLKDPKPSVESISFKIHTLRVTM